MKGLIKGLMLEASLAKAEMKSMDIGLMCIVHDFENLSTNQ